MIQPFCDILLYVLHYKDPTKEKSDKFCKNILKKGMPSTGFDLGMPFSWKISLVDY